MLKELLPEHQQKIIKKRLGDKVLNMDIPDKTDNIVEGEWTLTKDEQSKAISLMFGMDTRSVRKAMINFKPSERFLSAFINSKPNEINILKPGIIDIDLLSKNIFKLISANETRSNRMIRRSENGHPITENGKIVYIDKNVGDIVYSNNKSNINAFIESYNLAFPDDVVMNPFTNNAFTKVISMAKDRKFEFDLFGNNDIQLYISSKPEDILNMSVSKYFNSCQNLYDGAYNTNLPPNIFDKNMKIAYLRLNVPYTDSKKNVVPFTIFSRCIIRNIRGSLYFDVVYPQQLRTFFYEMITQYTGMKSTYKGSRYYFTDVGIGKPYMDTLRNPVGMKFNAKASTDLRLIALADLVGETAEYILDVSNAKTDDFLYATEKGVFQVLTLEEANDKVKSFIRDEMVYKQSIYKEHVNVEKFLEENKDNLKGYTGGANFDEIAKWANEKPEISKKTKRPKVNSKLGNAKQRITMRNLYKLMKPFIAKEFFDERLTPDKIDKKRSTYGEDGKEIMIEENLFAYLRKDQNIGNQYAYDDALDLDDDED